MEESIILHPARLRSDKLQILLGTVAILQRNNTSIFVKHICVFWLRLDKQKFV